MPHLHAALIPPPPLLDAVQGAIRSASSAPPAAPTDPRRGPRGWRRRGTADRPAAGPDTQPTPIILVPPDEVRLPLTAFGSVARGDTARLEQAIRAGLADIEPPTVWFAGAAEVGEEMIGVSLQGDLEQLGQLAHAVPRAVEALGFFVDRRQYRPMLVLARVGVARPAEVQPVTIALEEFRGEPWTVTIVSLMKRNLTDEGPESTVVEQIAVGPGA